jgi:replicative DNA helicase
VTVPANIAAEKATLGAILLDNRQLGSVAGVVSEGDFSIIPHQLVFRAMLAVAEKGEPIEAVTIITELGSSGTRAIGGAIVLSTLSDATGAPSSASLYAAQVRDCAIKRRALVAADKIKNLLQCDDVDPESVTELAASIGEVRTIGRKKDKKLHTLAAGVSSALAGLKEFASGDNSNRIQFGIPKIDRALRGGMIPGGLYVFGAPSGGGKTTVMQHIAVNCARTRGPVLFSSPEMALWELAEREVIRMSGVPLDRRGPWCSHAENIDAEALHVRAACQIESEKLPIYCLDEIDAGMSDIVAKARTIPGIRLVIIDYAQEVAKMSSSIQRYLAVGDVGKDAIRLGKQLGCPVLIASQVNVFRHGKTLEYSFRESSKLEHKAHAALIMELKRSEMPNQNGYFDVESARIFAKKNRSGPMFSAEIEYEPSTYRISEKRYKSTVWTPTERYEDDEETGPTY